MFYIDNYDLEVFMNELVALEEKEILVTDTRTIAEKIYTIRGTQVMLDSDLAEIYGYETKNFNRQVKNNSAKFEGDDFMFQLSDEEVIELTRCKNFTLNRSKGRGSNIKYNPYVFTEQGIYMLMTVLHGELAIKQSRALIRIFKNMKDYLYENKKMLTANDVARLSMQVNDNTKDIHEVKENMVTKNELEEVMKEFIGPNLQNEYLFLNGEKFKADLAYEKIYNSAKHTIYIVDNYIGPKTLVHLKDLPSNIDVIIFSDNLRNGLHQNELADFQLQYPDVNISFQTTNGKYHDRYIILDFGMLDEVIYHCGASSKDAGNKITSISKVKDVTIYQNMVNDLLLNPALSLI